MKPKTRTVVLFGVLVFIAFTSLAYLIYRKYSASKKSITVSIPFAPPGIAPVFGDSLAPIQIVVFSDTKCSYCREFWEKEMPVLNQYIAQQGKAQVIWRDLTPSKGELPTSALLYGAYKMNKSQEALDVLFKTNGQIKEKDFGIIATQIGLDSTELLSQIHKIDIYSEIKKQFAYAKDCNLKGTPYFAIQGTLFEGFMSANDIIERIEKIQSNIPLPNKAIPAN